jgi:hypothetical protein
MRASEFLVGVIQELAEKNLVFGKHPKKLDAVTELGVTRDDSG